MNGKAIAHQRPVRAKWLVRITVAMLLYTGVGFLLLPALLKSQLLKRLPKLTHRQVAIQKVRLNPYTLSLTIGGLSLAEADGQPFASWQELYVNFQLSSIFQRAWHFKEIRLKQPFGQITLQTNGQFNFADMLPSPSAPAKPASRQPIPRVIIDFLHVDEGSLSFADLARPNPFRTRFNPINVRLTRFTTRPGTDNPYSFAASTDAGESFSWSGDFTLEPLYSRGNFKLGGLALTNYSSYLQDFARFDVLGGKIDLGTDYRFSAGTNGLDLSVSNAAFRLSNLQLKASDTKETVISVPSLSLEQAEASLLRRSATARSLKSSGAAVLVRRNRDGTLHLLSLLNPPRKTSVSTNSAAPAAPFIIGIDEIAFDNYSLEIDDQMPTKPARLTLDQLALNLKGFSTRTNAAVTATVAVRLNKAGTVAVSGAAHLFPPAADLDINVADLDLRPFQPYVEEQLQLSLTGGLLNTRGHVVLSPGQANVPLLRFTGEAGLNNFASLDQTVFKDFLKWDSLTAKGIELEVHPNRAQLEEIKWVGLRTGLVIGPDKRPNLQTILARKAPASVTPVPVVAAQTNVAPKPALEFPMKLAAFVLSNASFHFSDLSLQPHCDFEVKEFNGIIKGLSSDPETSATVDLTGNVDERAPFSITGKVNPLSKEPSGDIAISFTNTELTVFTPYLEKYAGYPLHKGKLSLALHYQIAGQQVQARNAVFVDQLTLGPKNNSPDATHLPVKLAVALLKDRQGRIQLDLPINGRLDDPQFSIGPIILKVFVNVLTKAVASPFALLGAMFGAGEELSFVSFEPGRADLLESESRKLDTLAKAFVERPALNLEITGSADLERDRPALSWLRLEQQLKKLRMEELTAKGAAPAELDQVTLEPKDYARLLRSSYKKTFGRSRPLAIPVAEMPDTAATNIVAAPARKELRSSKPEPAPHGAEMLLSPKAVPKAPVDISSVDNKSADAHTLQSASVQRPATLPALPADDERLAAMEAELRANLKITDSDLLELMEARARQVQAYLLKTEKVAAERLFLIAPKLPDPSSKGESRANLSLD